MPRFTIAVVVLIACALVLALSGPTSWAAAAGGKNPDAEKPAAKKGPNNPPPDAEPGDEEVAPKRETKKPIAKEKTDDQKKIAAIRADMDKDVDKAIEAARDYVKDGLDEDAKTDAMGVIADGLRKKGDWRGAQAAYIKTRERCEKGSEDYLRYDSIADVLKSAPAGIYVPPGGPKAGAAKEDAKPLSDDAVLESVLSHLAQAKLERLKARMVTLKRAKSPQEVVTLFTPISDDYRQAVSTMPAAGKASADAASTAGTALQELSEKILEGLRAKQAQYEPKMDKPWTFTNVDKGDLGKCQAYCRDLASSEHKFQSVVGKMAGPGNSADFQRVIRDSEVRKTNYERMADGFVVPKWTEIGGW
jgi:hypothetical protein